MLKKISSKWACCIVLSATYSSAWIFPSYIHRNVRAPNSSTRTRSEPPSLQRQSTALSLTPRDIERLGGMGNDGDDGGEGDVEAEAWTAREALERMWSSSPSSDDGGDGIDGNLKAAEGLIIDQPADDDGGVMPQGAGASLPEFVGGEGGDGKGAKELEVRRENPFPTSAERGALEAAAAVQKALVAGKRGLLIDVEVKQLDDADAEFDAELLIQFITDIAKAVAAISGKTKVLLRGQQLAASATETLQRENMEGVEVGIQPREDVSFSSFRAGNLVEEGDPDSMAEFASKAVAEFSDTERVVIMACPSSNPDLFTMREVIKAAKGRPVVILNPRMLFMPTETNEYETAYLLKQFTVQPVKTNPKKGMSMKITKQQRLKEVVFSEAGQVVPKVLTTRAFPDDFKLYLDVDGKGFKLEETYDEYPHASQICTTAQFSIQIAQQKMIMEQQAEEMKKLGLKGFWDDDD